MSETEEVKAFMMIDPKYIPSALGFKLSLEEFELLHRGLKELNRHERAKDKKLALDLALRMHSFIASERTRRSK